MLKKILTCFVFFALIQSLLVESISPIQIFKPTPRHLHAVTYINTKLYIVSGMDDTIGGLGNGIGSGQFFCLDVSVPFSTLRVPWVDLTSQNKIPPQIGSTAVKGGPKNNEMILYGGRNLTSVESKYLVYSYDTQKSTWNIPLTFGENFVRRRSLTAIIDNKRQIYLFGGRLVGSDNEVNDMIILDSTTFSWRGGSSLFAPSPRINYGAVLLPNQNIIYIGGGIGRGGESLDESLPLNEVYLYDTINNSWSTRKTSGAIPSNRFGLSAVLGLDGKRVIIFGGQASEDAFVKPEETLYTLNLDNFEWSIPKVSGRLPSNRKMHRATVVGNYMVVTFGAGYNQSESSDVLLLDISNNNEYKWTMGFMPSSPVAVPLPAPVPSKPSEPSKPKKKAVIIGTVVGAILLSGLSIGMFFAYRWNRNRKSRVNVLPVSSKLESQSEQKEVAENNNKVENEETKQVQQ